MSCCCFSCCQQTLLSINLSILGGFFFLISSLFSLLAFLVASRPGKVRTLLQHSCAIDGAPHCFVLRRHSDPHPDVVFLIEMLPHLISANPVAVQLLLACLRCCCLICTSCLLCRECANPDAEQALAFVSDLSSRLSLRSVHEAIGFAPNCFVLWRHPDPDCKGVFH